jgi:hypothetical protein
MHAVEIAEDVELQVHRPVIGGPAGVGGFYVDKAKIIEIEAVDEVSMKRTGLLSSTQSSRHSGNSVVCARSAPATKPAIATPADSVGKS